MFSLHSRSEPWFLLRTPLLLLPLVVLFSLPHILCTTGPRGGGVGVLIFPHTLFSLFPLIPATP